MPNAAYGEYLESQVLTADPLELVRLLYRGAIAAIRQAQIELAAGRIAERSARISKAYAILTHLGSTLDHTRGGTLSGSLAELYDYMERRLLEANLRQTREPLMDVERLLVTLLEAWENIGAAGEPAPVSNLSRADGDNLQYGAHPGCFAAPPAYPSQSWSF